MLNRLMDKLLGLGSCLFEAGTCLACGQLLDSQSSFCESCNSRFTLLPNPCPYCGLTNHSDHPICPVCLLNSPRWQKMIAPLIYQDLSRDYLLQIKFADALHLAKSLTEKHSHLFRASGPTPQVLIPVPLHRDRLIERGYNQAYEIAQTLSQRLKIPLDRSCLTRHRATASQSGLSANQRKNNILKAFSYKPTTRYSHVAIVDDIVTTGSTVNEITKQLHSNGVEFVEVWALARVSPH